LRVIELARRIDASYAELPARYYGALSLLSLGNLEEARRQAADMLAPAERLRDRFWLAMACVANMIVSRMEGDWDSAREFWERGLAIMPSHPSLLSFRIAVEYDVGEFGQGESYLERFLEVMDLIPPGPSYGYTATAMFIPLVARTTGVPDRFDIAELAAETVLSSPSAGPGFVMWVRAGLALIAAHRGDIESAEEQYTALEPHRGILPTSSPLVTDYVLGLLSVTLGKFDQAMAHFEDASNFYRNAGYRPEMAWTCCDYADTLLQRDYPGDREKANSLLDESLAISTELGMRPLMERVLSRREILGA